eukprot:scaffold122562_cov36-Phaeocystis_antarctica.AAC.1
MGPRRVARGGEEDLRRGASDGPPVARQNSEGGATVRLEHRRRAGGEGGARGGASASAPLSSSASASGTAASAASASASAAGCLGTTGGAGGSHATSVPRTGCLRKRRTARRPRKRWPSARHPSCSRACSACTAAVRCRSGCAT